MRHNDVYAKKMRTLIRKTYEILINTYEKLML